MNVFKRKTYKYFFFKINRFIKNYHMINFPRKNFNPDACKS